MSATVSSFSFLQHLVFDFRPNFEQFFGSGIQPGFRRPTVVFGFLFGVNFGVFCILIDRLSS